LNHIVSTPTPAFLSESGSLRIHQIPVWRDNLVWVAECTATGEAAVIDGPEAQPVLDWAKSNDVRITSILNTHTHPDHVGINHELAHRGLLDGFRVVGPRLAAAGVPGLTVPVDDGDEVTIGAVRGKVWLTEGHIDGHVSYLFDNILFSGDTLFTGGCGYLFDGPPAKMFHSLMRLASLPDRTMVCCAHEYTEDNLLFAWSVEPDNEALARRIREVWAVRAEGGCTVPTTLAVERATNPFLRPGSPTLRANVSSAMGEALSTHAEVFAATRALKDRKDHKTLTAADLPLA
jgi:hydroxyacylglutathione hydrolase